MTFVQFLQTWVPLAVGICTLIGIIVGAIIKGHKAFKNFIKDEIGEVAKEFKPNGGSSLKDQVNRLETGHNEIVSDVKELKDDIIDIKNNSTKLEEKLDKMFDMLLELVTKISK
jgi:hypothetical protein